MLSVNGVNLAGKQFNPFEQFRQLCIATEFLHHAKPTLVDEIAKQYRSHAQTNYQSAHDYIAAVRIAHFLRDKFPKDKFWANETGKLLADLKKNGYWTEKVFAETLTSRENTVFAPFPFHISDIGESEKLDKQYASRTISNTRSALHRIIDMLHINIDEGDRSAFHVLKSDKDGWLKSIFNPLSDLHHEISDNAYWHGLKTRQNLNYNISRDEIYFGDTLYLQINLFSAQEGHSIDLGEYAPKNFKEYEKINQQKHNKRERRYLVLSYGDNGPGITSHLNKYGIGLDGEKSLIEVVQEKLTTRENPGAGGGFSNMITAIEEIDGMLILKSGNQLYSYDGISKTDHLENDLDMTVNRGTLISCIFRI